MGELILTNYKDTRSRLDALEKKYLKFLELDSSDPLRVVLGSYVGNLLPGNPIALLVVGPPASGKTETINVLYGATYCTEVSTFTEGALLSGTPRQKISEDATGGLLLEMGDFGILLSKDFTTVLSMHVETRNRVLALLREALDGRVTRAIGSDGGRVIRWKGKVGFIGGVTGIIDRTTGAIREMGDRFLLTRMRTSPELRHKQALSSVKRRGVDAEERELLQLLTRELLASVGGRKTTMPDLPPSIEIGIVAIAELVAVCRSPVERDGRTREVLQVVESEGPARLVQQFRALYHGLVLIGGTPAESWELIRKVANDTIPQLRVKLLNESASNPGSTESQLISASFTPRTSLTRALTDLELLGVIEKMNSSKGDARYSVNGFYQEILNDIDGTSAAILTENSHRDQVSTACPDIAGPSEDQSSTSPEVSEEIRRPAFHGESPSLFDFEDELCSNVSSRRE